MRIGVIIPDRSDRPRLLENCLRMLRAQTLQPEIIELVNDKPMDHHCDITRRYRMGYDRLRSKEIDLVAFIENDDWYSPVYLETMATEWEKAGRPNIFGTNYTIYYHIKLFAYFTMHHSERSSAMSTVIKPDLEFPWCSDNEPFTDMYLWNKLKGKVFDPKKLICLGIKHGEGLCGGRSHIDRLHRYKEIDTDLAKLKSAMDVESFNFYSNYFKQ